LDTRFADVTNQLIQSITVERKTEKKDKNCIVQQRSELYWAVWMSAAEWYQTGARNWQSVARDLEETVSKVGNGKGVCW